MRRFLKKFSSLCLTFALSTSGFLDLSANAAWEDIDDFYLTAGEKVALGEIRFEGLNPREVRKKVDWCKKILLIMSWSPFLHRC